MSDTAGCERPAPETISHYFSQYGCVVGCQVCARVCPSDAISFPSREELKRVLKELRQKYGYK